MNKILVVVNGYPKSGKDSFVDYCITHLQKKNMIGIKYSTISTCVELAKFVGWDGEKDDASRVMLSELKNWYTKHFDGTFNEMVRLMTDDNHKFDIIFSMIREPEEIIKIDNWCTENNFLCITILMDGRGERHHLAHSDYLVENYHYDQVIVNDGSLESLERAAEKFVDDIYI